MADLSVTMNKEKLKELERDRIDRDYAHQAVRTALKNGSLVREPCFCGNTRVEAHHADYKRPLDVIWACRKHHVELDKMKKAADIREATGLIVD